MRVVCINTDKDINYFLYSFNIICEHWSDADAKFNFKLALKQENQKQIIIVDYDLTKWIQNVIVPSNWYIIAITSDLMFKSDKMTIINRGASTENILNVIQDITDEVCYMQLGMFPLYLGVTRRELVTPKGTMVLGKKEWRILNYLNLNKGRRVYCEELKYHVLDVGEEEELADEGKKIVQVFVCKLRKKFSLILNSPVISYGRLNSGYYLLDYYNEDWEYLVNKDMNGFFIVIDNSLRKECEDLYEKLAKEIAAKSIEEIRSNLRLTCRNRRYNFLKSNLTFKEFTLSRLMGLLQRIRFKKQKRMLKKAEVEALKELEDQK